MKKTFLAGLFLTFSLINAEDAQMISAADGLKGLLAQMDEKAQLSALIRKAILFFSDEARLQELINSFIASLNPEERALLLEQCKAIAAINAKAADPEFQAQFQKLNIAMQALNNPDLTEQDTQIILQTIQKECPLVIQWLESSQELKDLQEAFGQTIHLFPVDLLLTKMIAQLEQV